ncbi:PREDICTED: proline-rich protein 3 [Tarenaya hassleriana]|uniref:proline-rich protein 3 n=1 Tax=Tarenaya hassleriana TaxID=28532 RepID=UPI00053C5EF6|nr:PREDICTED: proline-rich protein 3 [Tarenaya hassleriana]
MCTTRAAGSFFIVVVALAAVAPAEYYEPKPTTKPPSTYTPKAPSNINIAIDGVVLCKAGYPIQGARVKVVCPLLNSYGKPEALIVVSSSPTDTKGYFYFVPYGLTDMVKNVKACRVKLESSPLSACKIPTNVNKGIAGTPLSSDFKILPDKNLKLYTVGPFFFSGHVAPKPGH